MRAFLILSLLILVRMATAGSVRGQGRRHGRFARTLDLDTVGLGRQTNQRQLCHGVAQERGLAMERFDRYRQFRQASLKLGPSSPLQSSAYPNCCRN